MTSLSMIFGYRFFISSFLLHTCFPFQHAWHPLHSNILRSPRKIDSVLAPASRAPSKIRDTMTCVFPFFRGLPMIPNMFFIISTCPHNAPAKLRALSEKEASRQLQPVVRHACYLTNSDNIFSATSSNVLTGNLHRYVARLVLQSIFRM